MKTQLRLKLMILFLVTYQFVFAQSDKSPIQKKFEGTWYDKQEKRYIFFVFDGTNRVTINEWSGSSKLSNAKEIDAYDAFVKGEKLIMSVRNQGLHAPYAEISIQGKILLIESNAATNFVDNKLIRDKNLETRMFRMVRR